MKAGRLPALQEVGEVNKVLQMKIKPWIGWVIGLIILLFIFEVVLVPLLSMRRSDWAPRAKKTLRAYGETQEA